MRRSLRLRAAGVGRTRRGPSATATLATISGEWGRSTTTTSSTAPGTEVLGPVEVDDGGSRLVIRVPRAQGPALSRALGEVQRVRSARKLDAVRIQVDPVTL